MKIKQLFLDDIKMGLNRKTNRKALVKCYLTYVQKLPTGCERGRCLVLEVTGDNISIMHIDLRGRLKPKFHEKRYTYPNEILSGSALNLFDYIAECLGSFVREFHLYWEDLPLALSLAFPVKQHSVYKGDLVAWSKNFNFIDLVGSDVVKLLQSAIERRKVIRISTIVLMNDTTALLMSGAYKKRFCKIAVIVDNGCNASYVEQIKYISTFQQSVSKPVLPWMVISTEWTHFGDNGTLDFVQTDWDEKVREHTPTLNTRIFEKMSAGLYLGPLVREIILDALQANTLLQGVITPQLKEPNSFDISYIFDIVTQSKDHHFSTKEVLNRLGYRHISQKDLLNVRYICEMVCKRSAHLIAATLACLVDRVGDPYLVVAIDGILVRSFPQYQAYINEKLKTLVMPEHKFDLIVPEVNAGCGAALVALYAAHQTGLNKFFVPTKQRKTSPKAVNVQKRKHMKRKCKKRKF